MMLESRFAMVVAWRPDFRFFYMRTWSSQSISIAWRRSLTACCGKRVNQARAGLDGPAAGG
jgi:hypothetical protein